MSGQVGCWSWPRLSWHIDPVRSSTSMMSTCLAPHGEHAAAWTFRLNELTPMIFAKYVGTLAASSTDTIFTGEQPGIVALQLVATVSVTATSVILFLPVAEDPNCFAVVCAAAGS